MDVATNFGLGVLTGSAVAMPLGAIGLLLAQEGARVGWRRAWPAAAGVATADLMYCAAVLVFGAAITPILRAVSPWPALISAVTLVSLGVWGLHRAVRARPRPGSEVGGSGPARRYFGYLGLTIINPATATSFLAVTTGLEPSRAGAAGAVAFAVGVTAASLAWQSMWVAAGGILRRRGGPAARSVSVIVGNTVVIALGVAVLVGAVGS